MLLYLQVLTGEFHKWPDTIENDREMAFAMTEIIDKGGIIGQTLGGKKKFA
jgi:hypothetical protein